MQQDETMTCYKRLVYFTKKLTEGPDLELTHLGGMGSSKRGGTFKGCPSEGTVWLHLGDLEVFLSAALPKVTFEINPRLGHFPHGASHPVTTPSLCHQRQQVPWRGQASYYLLPASLSGWSDGAPTLTQVEVMEHRPSSRGRVVCAATRDQWGKRQRRSVTMAAILLITVLTGHWPHNSPGGKLVPMWLKLEGALACVCATGPGTCMSGFPWGSSAVWKIHKTPIVSLINLGFEGQDVEFPS